MDHLPNRSRPPPPASAHAGSRRRDRRCPFRAPHPRIVATRGLQLGTRGGRSARWSRASRRREMLAATAPPPSLAPMHAARAHARRRAASSASSGTSRADCPSSTSSATTTAPQSPPTKGDHSAHSRFAQSGAVGGESSVDQIKAAAPAMGSSSTCRANVSSERPPVGISASATSSQ